jgi:hypothetical protein
MFSNDVALNHRVAPVLTHSKASIHTKRRMLYVGWVVAAECLLRNVGAFQLRRPLQAAGNNASVHRFQSQQHLVWKLIGGNNGKSGSLRWGFKSPPATEPQTYIPMK